MKKNNATRKSANSIAVAWLLRNVLDIARVQLFLPFIKIKNEILKNTDHHSILLHFYHSSLAID
jgi:hypothetical protein